MRALRNILHDTLIQLRVRGGLWTRILCVLSYYFFYGIRRLKGEQQDASRLKALGMLAHLGISNRIVRVRYPPTMTMELDAFSASFLLMEHSEQAAYTRLSGFRPQAGQVVVDVGGHQGLFTLEGARLVGKTGRVIVIEPCPANRELLARNVAANRLSQVTVVAVAATDHVGQATLYTTDLVSGGHSLAFNDGERNPVTVPADTLDRILSAAGVGRVDLIKIDVEGAYRNVLLGAKNTLDSKPRLVMEVEGGERVLGQAREFVESLGYRTTAFDSVLYAERKKN